MHNWHERHHREEFLRRALVALKFNGIDGDYAEFGCCGAMTFTIVHRFRTTYPFDVGPFHQWAFDSFQGLPPNASDKDPHPQWRAGAMSTGLEEFEYLCRMSGMRAADWTAVPGFFEQTLDPSAPGPRPSKVRLAYVDCDLYSSTMSVLRFLLPRLQHGMIIAFDDYHCWSASHPSGERLAAEEVFANSTRWRLVPYVQFGWHGMSFVVEAIAGFPPGSVGVRGDSAEPSENEAS